MRSVSRVVLIVIVVLLLIGVIAPLAQTYVAYRELVVEELMIRRIGIDVMAKEIILELIVRMRNPTSYSIEADVFYADMYFDEEYLGYIERASIIIPPGVSEVSFHAKIEMIKIPRMVLRMISEGQGRLRLKGYVMVPVKLYGMIRLFSIQVPFEVEKELSR
ncbi:MAG: hypothetical protein DRN15_07825 [Thermoprotei archaeon]|nr:MAG: hypothetical protein DRN15_07825 [Thermoprotei archaeon]RLF25418.1 MAG: hypothetical protein DRM97_01810 [Thermoprotei archaeon]